MDWSGEFTTDRMQSVRQGSDLPAALLAEFEARGAPQEQLADEFDLLAIIEDEFDLAAAEVTPGALAVDPGGLEGESRVRELAAVFMLERGVVIDVGFRVG